MTVTTYDTAGGIRVPRTVEEIPIASVIEPVVQALDAHRGVLLASSYEYPGRYTRWDVGFVDPPLVLTARRRGFRLEALNARGRVLLSPIAGALRALGALFHHPEEPHLGLYGAFGYDLAFQFEPIRLRLERPREQRDLVLYLPDELVIVDHRREVAMRRRYEFEAAGRSTDGLPRVGTAEPYVGATRVPETADHERGAYAAVVRRAREAFKRGDLFEVVPGQTFFAGCPSP